MKTKTAIQKKVAQLSATLQPITDTQIQWAYDNCVDHIAYRTKSGTLTADTFGKATTAVYVTPSQAAPAPTAVLISKCRTPANGHSSALNISASPPPAKVFR